MTIFIKCDMLAMIKVFAGGFGREPRLRPQPLISVNVGAAQGCDRRDLDPRAANPEGSSMFDHARPNAARDPLRMNPTRAVPPVSPRIRPEET
jgi:hypothetical protein